MTTLNWSTCAAGEETTVLQLAVFHYAYHSELIHRVFRNKLDIGRRIYAAWAAANTFDFLIQKRCATSAP